MTYIIDRALDDAQSMYREVTKVINPSMLGWRASSCLRYRAILHDTPVIIDLLDFC